MTGAPARRYHEPVPASRSGAWRPILVGALLCSALAGRPQPASASSASFDVADQAVVQVIGRSASITIRTWNRNTVQIDWPAGAPFEAIRTTQRTPSSYPVPPVTVDEYNTPSGAVMATLPPEDFPVPGLTPGMHDVVRVEEMSPPLAPGRPASLNELTVTVPGSSGWVIVRTTRGSIALSNYHGTTFAQIGRGRIVLRNVSGDAFVQPLNGRFYALNSDFERLRIRSNHADQVFDACRVKQIEATTLTGNILFDNGVFNEGLARFESDRGSIALGVNGGAQLGAHTQDGRVLTVLPANEPPQPLFGAGTSEGEGTGDAVQLVGNGGPLVNASSVHGNVFLYDGSLTERRPATLGAEWRPMYNLLVAARASSRFDGPRAKPKVKTSAAAPRRV
jgi:hypothetical protein